MASKVKDAFAYVKRYWNIPDAEHGKYVSGKEYLYVFLGVAANYAAQAPFKYIGFAASCYLIMYHYALPYLSFAVISLIGLPLSFLWSLLDWFITDNLGILPKNTEKKMNILYISVAAAGILLLIFDGSKLFPQDGRLITALNGLSGINAHAFFKIFGVQLLTNGWGGARNIFWRKKLIPKHGRYKFSLYANVIQKSVMIVLLGWLPAYRIADVYERLWIAYLLFMMFSMFDFTNKLEKCSEIISPNSQERIFMRTYPIKICHLLNSVVTAVVPMLGSFDDINFYRFVLPGFFLPCAALTMVFAGKFKERIPQPPLEKKQQIPFWYGIFQVMRNKYRWLNMFSTLFDTLGNGMLDITTVIMLYTMRLSGAEYSAVMAFLMFRTTIPTFFAPWVLKRFSFKKLRIFREVIECLHCIICILALLFLKDNIRLCGIVMFSTYWMRDFLGELPKVAERDMNIRLFDYQMYLSGERLEGFTNIFGWFVSPIATLVGLIIPLLILRGGFNSNWSVLFLDSARFNILAVPLAFDLVGHVLMMIPYFFWDYNLGQHEYVIRVLKQREKLANEGYFPDEYDGSLTFEEPGRLHAHIPEEHAVQPSVSANSP
ncbi:MAG: MFS transporter [Clostridia bacterium]|nr:MFS transporter [Clostridia bacterium]